MAKLKLWLMILGVLSVLGTGAYLYVDNLLDENRVLKSENARQELVIANRDQVIAEQEQAIGVFEKQVEKLQLESMEFLRKSAENQEKYERAIDRLSRHNRNYLVISKPDLTAKILDKESRDFERCWEITVNPDAELTEKELNATKPSEINRECWEDVNPNFNPGDWPEWERRNSQ